MASSNNRVIEAAMVPLRDRRDQLQREVDVLQREIESKRQEMRELDTILKHDPRRVQSSSPKPVKKKKDVNGKGERGRRTKRFPGTQISDTNIDAILEAMRILGEPGSRAQIMRAMDSSVVLSETSVGKALGDLTDTGVIRKAGVMQGVKGRRPLYALWPEQPGDRVGLERHDEHSVTRDDREPAATSAWDGRSYDNPPEGGDVR